MSDLTINDIQGIVIATTELVRNVGKKFIRANNQDAKEVVDLQVGGREIKLAADKILEKLDFVFIDASHSTKGVVRDINAYRPILNNKQGLTGHDIDFPAVQAALKICEVEFEVGPDNVWQQKF